MERSEVKLALVIVGFAALAYASPYIWNRYDKTPVIAAEKTGTESLEARPKPEYVIKSFFYYIDSSAFNNALSQMDPEYIKYDSKIWRDDFANIYFIKLRNLELKDESDGLKKYLARLDVRLKGNRLKTSWKNGENERIITVKLTKDNLWAISSIDYVK